MSDPPRTRFSYDDPLPAEEFIRLADQALAPHAIEEMVEHIRWFKRRYPTAKERFAYATERTRALRRTQSKPTP
ncbi:MAG TPA: hypothetical protein VIJ22_19945 [Polyangiaceae bacterium]